MFLNALPGFSLGLTRDCMLGGFGVSVGTNCTIDWFSISGRPASDLALLPTAQYVLQCPPVAKWACWCFCQAPMEELENKLEGLRRTT